MELSLLLHTKDNSPKRIRLEEVADIIREGRWPSGYPPILLVQGVFEGGTRQEDIVSMSGLAVVSFTGLDHNGLLELRQAARDDPHTMLLFGSDDDGLTLIYAYEIDKSYDVDSQRKFYQKVLIYGNDYYEAQLDTVPLRKGKDVGKRRTLCHDPEVVNHMVLVLIGPQGIGKTSWMNHLLPPCLRSYYCTQNGIGRNDKDAEIALSQYALINCEELDKMSAADMNAMKRAITLNYTNVRKPYERYAERRPHIATFCGTGNNEKFLNDPTGTRRWLAFKVESLMSPLVIPFEYEGLYAQAYYLYKEGFQYWFDDSEATDRRNSRFMVPNLERQLVNRYFRLPTATDAAEFVDVATALQLFPVNVTSKIRKEAVDQAFIDQGFEPVTIDGNPGYFAIVRKPDEVRMMGLQMAYSARRAMTAESS